MQLAHSVTAMGSFKMEVMIFKYNGQVLFDHYFFLDKPLYDKPGIKRQKNSTSMQNKRCSIVALMFMPIPERGHIHILKEVNKMALDLLAHRIAVQISQEDNMREKFIVSQGEKTIFSYE